MRAGNPDESGQALVESALSFTILLFMLLGMVDLALLYPPYIAVIQAANAGAFYGSASATSAADVSGITTEAISVTQSWRCLDASGGHPAIQVSSAVPDGIAGSTSYSKFTVTVTCHMNDLTGLFGAIGLTYAETRRIGQ